MKDVLEQSPKAAVSKCAALLAPCAKLAGAGESDVREAGQEALVAFAVRSGSMGVLDKVGGEGWGEGVGLTSARDLTHGRIKVR